MRGKIEDAAVGSPGEQGGGGEMVLLTQRRYGGQCLTPSPLLGTQREACNISLAAELFTDKRKAHFSRFPIIRPVSPVNKL